MSPCMGYSCEVQIHSFKTSGKWRQTYTPHTQCCLTSLRLRLSPIWMRNSEIVYTCCKYLADNPNVRTKKDISCFLSHIGFQKLTKHSFACNNQPWHMSTMSCYLTISLLALLRWLCSPIPWNMQQNRFLWVGSRRSQKFSGALSDMKSISPAGG